MALSNAQHDAIMREYGERKLSAHRLQDERIKEVYSKDPEFEKLDKEMADVSIGFALKHFTNPSSSLNEVASALSRVKERRSSLLLSYGYPKDYLDKQYFCPDCQDTGYINGEKCHCFKELATQLLYSTSNIKNISAGETFSAFSFDYYDTKNVDQTTGKTPYESAREAVRTALDFINSFEDSFKNLFLYGDTGVGKTFLSNCIATELLNRNVNTIYLTSFELFDSLAKATFGKSGASNPYDFIFDCDLLIIDDLGTELVNSFVSSQLFLIINERILRQKSTIISTNLSVNGFASTYSERTFSRISSYYSLIKLTGDDIRIKKRIK